MLKGLNCNSVVSFQCKTPLTYENRVTYSTVSFMSTKIRFHVGRMEAKPHRLSARQHRGLGWLHELAHLFRIRSFSKITF